MADSSLKDAGIRITLKKDGFMVSIKGMEQDVSAAGQRAGNAWSQAMKAGVKGAEGAVKQLFSDIKSGVSSLAGIGGALGTGEMIRAGLKTEGIFKSIAFQVKAGTGGIVDWKTQMEAASASAQKWGKDVDELGGAMKSIFEETGNADFASKSVEVIATTARATRQPIEQLASLTGTLGEKFGITSDALGDTLASVYSLGNKGGVTVEELSQRLGVIGAVAREAGLQGAQGFTKMVGLLNVADDGGKNLRKNIGAVNSVLETLTTAGSRNKALMQLGLDPSQVKGDVTKQIGDILKKTGGSKDKLAVAFQGEGLAFMVSLGQQYAKTFNETSGSVKAKTDAAISAYETALANASKSQLTYAQVQEEAARRMGGGQAKIDAAVEKMKAAFRSDKIAEAVGRLADVMPRFAEMVSKLVGFAVDHPVLAGAGAVAGVGAKGFAGGAAESLAGAAWKAVKAGSPAAKTAGEAAEVAAGAKGAAETISTMSAFRKAVNDNIGPLGKLGIAAGAAAAVLLAYDQASKLSDELGESGWSDMWRELKHDVGITNDQEYSSEMGILKNGNEAGVSGAGPDQFTEWDADQRQRIVDYNQSTTPEDRAAAEAAKARAFYSDDKLPFEAAADARAGMGLPRDVRAAPVASQGGSNENARLFAQMMADRELKVRVINPEAIRGTGGALGGPAPGYRDRE